MKAKKDDKQYSRVIVNSADASQDYYLETSIAQSLYKAGQIDVSTTNSVGKELVYYDPKKKHKK